MTKTDFRKCRYEKCPYNHEINLLKDDYKIIGKTQYYHADCYKKKKSGEWKDEKTKSDLQYIKNQWSMHIDRTVVYSQLFRCLNDLLSRGISSNYLVFVIDYIIKNKMNLRYVNGFKYYVDKDEIKAAYQKQQLAGIKKTSEFTAVDSTDAPKFEIKQKQSGFGSIFKGGN
jgi:transposase